MRWLARRVARERAGRFVVEGPQAVREALVAHARSRDVVHELYVTPAAVERYGDEVGLARAGGLTPVSVSEEVLAAMTETVSPQGVVAVCRTLDRPLGEVLAALAASARGIRLVVVLAHVRDPGNAGTVLRAADAAGADAVVLTEASVDVHNPKCVRSTAGSLFHLPVVQGPTLADTVRTLRSYDVSVLAADGDGDHDLDDLLDDAQNDLLDDVPDELLEAAHDAAQDDDDAAQDDVLDAVPVPSALLRRPTAWVFGNEAWGLPDEHRALADAVVRVPIHGRAESLNLATAATVCLYASARAGRRPGRRRPVTR